MQASDARSTGRVMKAIVQLCFDANDWDMLNEHIVLLTKKRSQLKTVSMVVTVWIENLSCECNIL